MKLLPGLALITAVLCISFLPLSRPETIHKDKPQRLIIFMLDGFGEAYYRSSDMPTLNALKKKGIYKVVPSLMPSVTNLNNASICTGVLPERHGITGNSFIDPATQSEEFMEEDSLVLAPTLFERAKASGAVSLLFSSKKKTTGLLKRGTKETLSPETASALWTGRIGKAPDIYSREVNYWLMEAALYSIQNDPEAGIFYIHTTDYPMHTWAPEAPESKEHLHKLDEYIAKIIRAAPDAAILITADHTVNHKSLCWDLGKACAARGAGVRFAISPERDKYFKHHRGFGGAAYVYLAAPGDLARVRAVIRQLKGIDEVLTRAEAVSRFHLMPERIGDLMVLGDSLTVFGDLDTESEALPATYRSHGSLYEARVPLFVYNAPQAPAAAYFTENYKLAAWLYR